MSNGSLSKRLRRFIVHSITSVEQIEVLLLLRNQSGRAWTADEISRELRSSHNSIAQRLSRLRQRGLLVREADGRYRYDLGHKQDDVVGELQNEYETRRVRVIEAIYAHSADAMRSFADAFRLGEDQDDS
ncbi:MAG TPA: hypothetical protein VIG51_05900 [Candidatus Baltobacteraceae bacterium]|jgi:predicted transcriptional regulator